jgi:hypothetical protein
MRSIAGFLHAGIQPVDEIDERVVPGAVDGQFFQGMDQVEQERGGGAPGVQRQTEQSNEECAEQGAST